MPHVNKELDFTASAIVISPTQKILLHYHKKHDVWIQPGGHVDPGEDHIEALAHEILEETGLNIDDLEILDFSQPERSLDIYPNSSLRHLPIPFDINRHRVTTVNDHDHDHVDSVYVFKSTEESLLQPGEGESQEIGWFSLEELEDLKMYRNTRALARGAIEVMLRLQIDPPTAD